MRELALLDTIATTAARHTPMDAVGVARETKADGSPVSDVDLRVEALVVELIRHGFPNDAVLAEESGLHAGSSGRTWVVDPLDGTSSFLNGGDAWGTQVCVVDQHGPLAAVVTRPRTGRRWWAGRGVGAFREEQNGRRTRLAVSRGDGTSMPLRVSGLVEHSCPAAARLTEYAEWVPPGEYVMGALAGGELDCAVDDLGAVWDQAPAVLLVREAGGRVTTPGGMETAVPGWGCYSNGVVHDWLLDVLAPVGVARGCGSC